VIGFTPCPLYGREIRAVPNKEERGRLQSLSGHFEEETEALNTQRFR